MREYFKNEVFEWLKFQDREYIPTQMLSGVHYEQSIEQDSLSFIRDQSLYRLNAMVLGKKLPSFTETRTEVFNTPKNPWQFFKDMYADKWFMRGIVKRWPVKFVGQKVTLTATWDQWAAYPWLDKVPVSPKWQPVRIPFPAKVNITKEPFNESEKSECGTEEERGES